MDPYKIWLSEIILQQTRVNQGLSYYLKFTKTYPTIKDLACAEEDHVLKLWQGLGYYSRARNLHFTAKHIHKLGKFPDTYKELIKLKGIGEYTAAAISSFAFNENQAAIDGNVYRVISRLFGISTAIDSNQGKKEFKKIAESLLPKNNAAGWNQAMMEFGALQCLPKSPNCDVCPLNTVCTAFIKQRIKELPYKAGKTKQKTLYQYYFFFKSKGDTLLQKRPENGIWGGLFEFPNLEFQKKVSPEEALNKLINDHNLTYHKLEISSVEESIKHVLSHRVLFCTFFEIEIDQLPKLSKTILTPINNLHDFPVSRLTEKYITQS